MSDSQVGQAQLEPVLVNPKILPVLAVAGALEARRSIQIHGAARFLQPDWSLGPQ